MRLPSRLLNVNRRASGVQRLRTASLTLRGALAPLPRGGGAGPGQAGAVLPVLPAAGRGRARPGPHGKWCCLDRKGTLAAQKRAGAVGRCAAEPRCPGRGSGRRAASGVWGLSSQFTLGGGRCRRRGLGLASEKHRLKRVNNVGISVLGRKPEILGEKGVSRGCRAWGAGQCRRVWRPWEPSGVGVGTVGPRSWH